MYEQAPQKECIEINSPKRVYLLTSSPVATPADDEMRLDAPANSNLSANAERPPADKYVCH